MASQKRLKPFTFFGRVPHGVTTVELTKCLTSKFTKSELGGVQDFTAGKYEIFLKTRAAVERFLTNPVVVIRDTAVQFEYRGTRAKLVRVFGYSAEHQDVELSKAFDKYGKVLSVTRESVPGFPSVTTGIRRVKIEMTTPVPNFLEVIDTTVQCEFEGVVRVCRRCGGEGHFGAACDTPQCERCGMYGHVDCNDPCPKCGEDHAVSECTKRTFAAVTSQGLEADKENAVVADYWEPTALGLSPLSAPQAADKEAQPTNTPPAPREPKGPTCNKGEEVQDHVDEPASSPPDNAAPMLEVAKVAGEPKKTASKRKRKSKKNTPTATPTKEGAGSGNESPSSKSSSDKPHCKRQILASSSDESNSESDTESVVEMPKAKSLCEFCHLSSCDCSIMSDNAYSSSSEGLPSAVASP